MTFTFSKSFSQSSIPFIERTITITIINEKTDAALNRIAQQAGFNFSYNPALIDINKIVNISVTKKTVREVLNQLFNNKIEFKTKGKYIILRKGKEEAIKPESKKETFTVNGYVSDEAGEKIQWVSVYDKKSLASAITNEYGFYKLELNRNENDISLNASKQHYEDTAVKIISNTTQFLNLTLSKIITDTVKKFNADSLYEAAGNSANSIFLSAQNEANTKNIKDTIYRKTQVSLLPFIGTNFKLSGRVINDYSFNIFGGYSLGNRKLELGGFFNSNLGDVKGAQLAGFCNAVGGNVEGVQLAGFFNTIRKDFNGFQGAGFFNFNWGNFEGVQAAGYFNSVKGKFHGVQLAGFANTCIDSVTGLQGAGFLNFANSNVKGLQLAGFANITNGNVEGMQISLVNYARKVNGVQLGILNYAKEYKGVPIGLFSIVKDGYHKLEISADEIFYTNISYRTGVNSFHNIINAGIRPDNFNNPLWTFGYGIGSTIKLRKNVSVDIDLTSNQIVKNDNFDEINLLNKGYIGLDVKLAKKISVAFGATVNGQLTKTDYNNYPEIFIDNSPHIFYDHTYASDNTNLKMWMGGKVALRFL